MSANDNDQNGPRLISIRAMDIVVACALLAVAGIVIADSLRLGAGWLPNEGPAAGYFPFYIGLILAVASLANLVRAILNKKDGEATFVSRLSFRRVMSVLVPLVVYSALLAIVGMYVASAIYIAAFMWHFGKHSVLRSALVGLAIAIFFFLMFEIWFLQPLPKGPIEDFMLERGVPAISRWLGL